tara:strand:- start:2312 stop:3061 length:750 start_codon:yes stop_codon:yes gene_type:complete
MTWRKKYKQFSGQPNFQFLISLLDNCTSKAEVKKVLQGYNGGLSSPSKMPSFAYNIPAWECKVGSKLVNVVGSTCEKCYALRGRYNFSNVKDALYRRFETLQGKFWKESMVLSIAIFNHGKNCDSGYFRWHDSGDLQSIKHFADICFIAEMLPEVKFWLPTREYSIVKSFAGSIPVNLVVRYSAHMNNSIKEVKNKLQNSIVIDSEEMLPSLTMEGNVCHATRKESSHQCEDCRKCWDSKVRTIAYLKH